VTLAFGLALRTGWRNRQIHVVMTRTDDTFIPLGDRVQIARIPDRALSFRSMPTRCERRGRRPGRHHLHAVDHATDARPKPRRTENRRTLSAGQSTTSRPTWRYLIDLASAKPAHFHRFAHLLMVGDEDHRGRCTSPP